jgi:hypothetical protein
MRALMRHAGGHRAMPAPLGGDRQRSTCGRTGRADADDVTPVTPEEIATVLQALYGRDTVLGAVDNASRFTDATRQVEHCRAGAVRPEPGVRQARVPPDGEWKAQPETARPLTTMTTGSQLRPSLHAAETTPRVLPTPTSPAPAAHRRGARTRPPNQRGCRPCTRQGHAWTRKTAQIAAVHAHRKVPTSPPLG